MIRASLAALALSCSFAAVAAAAQDKDPWLWLEDIEGAKALDWVKKENAATDKLITTRPGFEADRKRARAILDDRSEEHTSELQSLMRISYAVFCLQKKIKHID